MRPVAGSLQTRFAVGYALLLNSTALQSVDSIIVIAGYRYAGSRCSSAGSYHLMFSEPSCPSDVALTLIKSDKCIVFAFMVVS
jgi:hypothetical protein